MPLRIANGAGFLGDSLAAPRRLVESCAVEYLTLEYLAELTMSILARAKEKNPALGYAEDWIEVASSLLPALQSQLALRIVTNAGGTNPIACAAATAQVLMQADLGNELIGVVAGDDLLSRLQEIQAAGCALTNLDTGQPLADLTAPIVSANAYLGARPIVDALADGARLVITGRVADASLTLGPAVFHHGWKWDDLDTLAGASIAGHLIECGAQATGGLFNRWDSMNLADVGYPIAEINADGTSLITKPPHTGGAVNRHTVAAQLV
ncbi:MAG: acyclic terpene utilization AtuA family protein, partial [Planctomycetota bacterium]|nr:acyclic terpene utilization AtuA family protein [Planctomycetota bacterium]